MSDSELTRLGEHGSELEQSVLGSANEDQPGSAVRSAIIARVVAEQRTLRHQRRTLATLGAIACSAAAAFTLVQRRTATPMILSAEPHSSTAPSAPLRARTPAPAPSAASPFEPCTPFAIAEGRNPQIDDFEDGDVRVPMLEHRAGQWFTFNDGTGSQLPKPGALFSATRIPGGRGASHFGLHNQGGKFSKWGANLSVELNPRRCYDASAYGGIEFWTRGRGEIRVVVEMTQIITEEFGGTCTHDCFDGHGKRIKLGPDFEHVVVRWEELRQEGFGPPLQFDARSLYAIKFSVQASQTPFDYWIDDVSFSPR